MASASFGRTFGAFDGLLWSAVLGVVGVAIIRRWVIKA